MWTKKRYELESLELRKNIQSSYADIQQFLGVEHLSLIVAVSGGMDSCVLLDALAALSNVKLVVAHLDHGLREASEKDALFVKELAQHYGLPCLIEHVSWDGLQNVEDWAHDVRYEFLERCRVQHQAHLVVTAHHQMDQAETLLLRLLSGRLLTEPYCIAEVSDDRHLWRPLLTFSKDHLCHYAEFQDLRWREDHSNGDVLRTRNRIRHRLLPKLQEHYNPQVISCLAKFAEKLAADEEVLQAEAQRVWHDALCRNDVALLRSLSKSVAVRVLALIARAELGEVGAKLGFHALERVYESLFHGEGRREIQVGFGLRAFVERDSLWFDDGSEFEHESSLLPSRLEIPGAVQRKYPDGTCASIRARIRPAAECHFQKVEEASCECSEGLSESSPETRVYFDLDKLQLAELVVRERRDGDQMRVWKRGARKVKKLFSERGLMLTLRDRIPIVEARNDISEDILWIPGVARSEFAPVSEETKLLLELSYSRV